MCIYKSKRKKSVGEITKINYSKFGDSFLLDFSSNVSLPYIMQPFCLICDIFKLKATYFS